MRKRKIANTSLRNEAESQRAENRLYGICFLRAFGRQWQKFNYAVETGH